VAGPLSELRWETAAIADLLASGSPIPVRPLLCIHGGALPQAHRSVESVQVVTHRQVADIVRHGSRLQPSDVEHATARALELLRPAV
jgi:hypothetical protein